MDKYKWSLDELYSSADSAEYLSDLEDFRRYIERLMKYASDNFKPGADGVKPDADNFKPGADGVKPDADDFKPGADGSDAREKIEGYIGLIGELARYEDLYSYALLVFSVDVMNETAGKMIDVLSELFAELTAPEVLFKQFLGGVTDLDEIIGSSPVLTEHRYVLLEKKEETKHMLSEAEEVIIARMQNTGSTAWEKLRDQLSATLTVDIEIGGEMRSEPLTVVRNYAYDADAALRKNAYEAELRAYGKIETGVAACMNGVKGEVLTTSRMRGYGSPLEMTLLASRMDKNILDAMFSAIDKYLPAFRKYLRHKAKLLGHGGSLPFYDLFAPVGAAKMEFTYDEACDYVVKNFNDFSRRLGAYARRAADERWIDVYPREGKQGGAFCASVYNLKQSRFMLNFKGSFQDICTLAHELGHGYHNECLKDETLLNFDHPMPIAETASTFCETIIINSALKTASKDEALAIIDNDLQGAAQVIVDIYSRYLFETEVFKRRADGGLSANELNEMMADAQRAAYGDGLDGECLHPYMWACKSHYYYASQNFYNFPYAYGHLFSKGLYAKFLRDGAPFVAEYDKILAATGKNSLRDIALLAGIDVTTPAFWESSLALIGEDIEKFIDL